MAQKIDPDKAGNTLLLGPTVSITETRNGDITWLRGPTGNGDIACMTKGDLLHGVVTEISPDYYKGDLW
jgi:hypothetical protein